MVPEVRSSVFVAPPSHPLVMIISAWPPASVLRRRGSCSTRAGPRRGSSGQWPRSTGQKVGQVVSAGLSVGWHTVPDKYALLGGQALGLLLGPVLSLLGIKGNQALLSFDQAAIGVTPGALRVQRERPFGSASIVGLGPEASPPALWNAALDLVSAGAEQILGVIEAESGPVDELVLTGGWAQSGGLRRRKRSLLARRRWPAVGEGGARGAALFGGCAAGLFTGPELLPPARGPGVGRRSRGGPGRYVGFRLGRSRG